MKSVKGKHVVITGGSSGIGLACARKFLREGASVTLIARNAVKLAAAKDELQPDALVTAHNGVNGFFPAPQVFVEAADVADAAAISAALDAAWARQPVDVLLLCAGVVRMALTEELPLAQVREQVDANLLGCVLPLQALLPRMKARAAGGEEPGAVVFVSSLSSLAFWFGASVYTATKYAVRGLAECLRLELMPYGIGVSVVCPGFTETPFLKDAESCSPYIHAMMKATNFYDRSTAEPPEATADAVLRATRTGSFLCTTTSGPVPFLLRTLSRGVMPASSIWLAILEVLVLPILRLLTLLAKWPFDREVRAIHKKFYPPKC